MGGQRERLHSATLAEALLVAGEAAGIGTTVTVRRGDGRLEQVFVNDAALAINGYSREEFLQRHALSFLEKGERERLEGDPDYQEAGSGRFETVIVRPSGEQIPIEVAVARVPWTDEEGGLAYVSYFFDLSARKQAENSLRRSEENLRRLIENAPHGISLFQDDRFVFGNRAALRLYGVASNEVLRGPLDQVVAAPDYEMVAQRLKAVQAGEQVSTPREYRRTAADGKRMVIEATSIPFEHENRPAVLTFSQDITERKDMAEHMARVDRLVALGTLAAGVAHEISNPVAIAATSLEVLERLLKTGENGPALRERALSVLSEARASTERVATIARELKGFSRSDEALGPVNLDTVLSSAERMTEGILRHRVRIVRSEGSIPPVLGNAGRLEQVFVNLLINAGQAMPAGNAEANLISIDTERHGNEVVVTVRDNGIGMPPEVLARVFDPFFTTKPVGEGTGLGLAICQTIITQIGGTITVESELNKGSTFRITLPLAPRASRSSPVPKKSASRRVRILVVDDEPTLVRTLVTLLGDEHDVVGATSGADALAMLLGQREFELVLCDLMMPYVTGMDLYERLARERPGLESRLVFMTGGAFTARARRFIEEVPNTRLDKPFSPATLTELIQSRFPGDH